MYNVSAGERRQNRLGQTIVSAVIALVVVGALANQLGLIAGVGQLWVTLFSSPEAEAYKKGMAAFQTMDRANMEPALAHFTEAITLNPNYVPAYRQRSIVYFLLKMPEQGMVDIDKAVELEPNNPELYYQRSAARFALENKESDAFMSDLDKAIELKANYFDALTVRGIGYTHLQQWDKALADLNRAVSLKPWRIDAQQEYYLLLNRGLVFFATNQLDAALADFDRTVQLFPKDSQPYRNRGKVYVQLGQFKAAAADYLKSLELEPDFDLTDVLPDFQNQLAAETDVATKAAIEQLIAKATQQ